MQWDQATNIILISALATLGAFACLGLYQWIKRKSLKKVDRTLLAMIPPLVLMVIVYVIFDYLWIVATRPNGSGEPSFPSTHVMVTATIFYMTILALPRYVKSRILRIILDFIMLVFVALVSVGRIFANMHWPSDVAGGLIFALAFAGLYLLIRRGPHA